ncbi:hypothetical protein F511_31163 [Dorcoceras hygrometricum]|uniref:Uncharacterized protein n=1 Tax=Dorcoceras hygrometricum TaxID=472368 RepID=A0A2Z7ANG3_9LAMI|nr:hypothetical protein F511_31163 [Dorcoceras hygrometricum]
MEWAVELAMETSRVKSVVRNQAEAKLNQLEHDEPAETTTTSCNRYSRSYEESQAGAGAGMNKISWSANCWMTSAVTSSFSRSYSDQQEDSADEKRCARYGMSCDDINLDVITISSWLSADEAKRKRRCDVTQESAGSLHSDARGSDVVEEIISRKLQCIQQMLFGDSKTIRKQQQHPVESLFESAVAIYSVVSYSVQSQEIQAQRIDEVARRTSRSDGSAAKQLTTYEEISKLDVNC